MEGIAPFQSGRPLLSEVTADKLNRILAEIKRNKPVVAAPLSARVTGDGTHISILQTGGGTSTPAIRQPWDLLPQRDTSSTEENRPYKVRVRPGTLNGILPSNWNQEFTCAATGLHYAKAVITTDGEAISGVSLAIDTTAPVLQLPQKFAVQTQITYLFGLFAEGSVYRVIGEGHIVLPTRTWLVTNASPAARPGESPYSIYYLLGP